MAARVLDIVGQPCDACDKNGVAKVIHFVQQSGKDRYFYGCSASTKDSKCAGSKAWQSIQVPEELKRKVLRDKGITKEQEIAKKKKKKRIVSEESDCSSGYEEFKEVVTTKTETSTTRTTKKVRRRRKDADHWTNAQDDDYAE